jgi:hypothetical protein
MYQVPWPSTGMACPDRKDNRFIEILSPKTSRYRDLRPQREHVSLLKFPEHKVPPIM